MIINPIIPVWLMGIICVFFLFLKRKGTANYIRQVIIVILLFVINLRIMVGNSNTETVTVGVDVLFVVDNTISMFAEDYDGDGRRMDAVRADCDYIMEQFPGASYSVVSFGNVVQTMLPYTIDTNNVTQALGSLNGQASYYAVGTSLNDVMGELGKILDNSRENEQIVFFISDGEITNEEKLKSFADIKKFIDGGAVLGYGTTKGGPMKAASFSGSDEDLEYLTYYDDNFDKQTAISVIDEKNLKAIASDMGIGYIHMTKQSEIDDELTKIKENIDYTSMKKEVSSTDGYADIYYYFMIPLLGILIFDFIYYRRKI